MNNYISTYALYHPNDAYLEHSLSWGKHRYIKRTGTPGNYKYFYAEDLRNAGRNLASGARNLVTRAGSAASNALSGARNMVANARNSQIQKRNAARTAAIRENVARTQVAAARNNRVNAQNEEIHAYYTAQSRRAGSQLRGGAERAERLEDRQARNRAQTNLDRASSREQEAYNNWRKASNENLLAEGAYKRTALGVRDTIKDFVRSKVGIGLKKEADNYRKTLNNLNRTMYDPNATPEERGRASETFEKVYNAYNQSLQRYGESFLGSLPRIGWNNGPTITIKDTQYRIR